MSDDHAGGDRDGLQIPQLGGPKVRIDSSAAPLTADEAAQLFAPEPTPFQPLTSIVGALGMGLMGAGAWAMFTGYTGYQVGFVAIILGLLVGYGATFGGRCRQAQVVGAVCAAISYFVGQLFVLLTLTGAGLEALGDAGVGALMSAVVADTFSGMGMLFLGIAVWEGWVVPRPR